MRIGRDRAASELGISTTTLLDAIAVGGMLQASTLEKVVAGLARIEAKALV